MGKKKYLKKLMDLFAKSQVVTFSSIQRVITQEKKKNQYAKQFVRNQIKQGRIQRLTRGLYTSRDEASLLVYGLQPAYLGLQDALSFHDVWEQETIPIIITTRKVRQGIRKVLGTNVFIRRIKKEYFFGVEYRTTGTLYLPYSDLEKTFLDMLYFRERMDKGIITNILKKINKKKLFDYTKLYPHNIRVKILRYL